MLYLMEAIAFLYMIEMLRLALVCNLARLFLKTEIYKGNFEISGLNISKIYPNKADIKKFMRDESDS